MVLIDNVYQTVLNILNKENRGYVTPTEFNTLAKQAQTEIFEMYFTTQYRVAQGPMSDGDYNDIMRNIEEKITLFDVVSPPITLDTTTGMALYPTDPRLYRLGIVHTEGTNIHVDEVSHKDVLYINLSPLTAPTKTQPVYTRHEDGIRVYPINSTTDTNPLEVRMVYIKEPATPQWVGASMMGQLVVDNSDGSGLQNFELHASEEPELVAKILAYSGVIIKAPDVVQAAAAKEQQIGQDNG